MKHLYEKLYEVKELINGFFSETMVMSLVNNFTNIVFLMFVKIIIFQKDVQVLTLKQSLFLKIEDMVALKIIAIMAVAERLRREVKKSGLILARLLSSAISRDEKEEGKMVREKMYKFQYKMIHISYRKISPSSHSSPMHVIVFLARF